MPPPFFDRSINSISSVGQNMSTTLLFPPPGFSDLPSALNSWVTSLSYKSSIYVVNVIEWSCFLIMWWNSYWRSNHIFKQSSQSLSLIFHKVIVTNCFINISLCSLNVSIKIPTNIMDIYEKSIQSKKAWKRVYNYIDQGIKVTITWFL